MSKFALITFDESKLHCNSSTGEELRVGLDSGSRVVGSLGNEVRQGLAHFLPRMSGREMLTAHWQVGTTGQVAGWVRTSPLLTQRKRARWWNQPVCQTNTEKAPSLVQGPPASVPGPPSVSIFVPHSTQVASFNVTS